MKNLYLVILAALMPVVAPQAQVVTTTPAVLTADTRDITVTLHADWGSQGLADLPQSQTVYAHTGVITSKSTSSSDWRYASAWGDNNAKYRMTRTGTNTYTLSIPDIRTYYGITDPAEKVERLAFVFRSTDGREGKTVSGGQAIASAVNLTDKKAYKLVSVSPGVTPTVNVSSVTLPAGAYALYATVSAAGTNDITADRAPYSVKVDVGTVTVSGEYGTATLHTLSGMSVPMTGLAPGLYILTVDGQSRKIAIR